MKMTDVDNPIQVFEHDKLNLGGRFKKHHLKALLKLNELHSFNYLEATSKGVKFKSYVGIVQVDNLTIEILPKIDNREDGKDKWRKILLKMLSIARKVKVYNSDHADVLIHNRNLLDVYLQLYLEELDQLIRKGLCKKYRVVESNVFALKGKLEIAGHISRNVVHKERFYTSHQVYDKDHIIHRILRRALEIVVVLTKQNYLASMAGRIDLAFPDLKTSTITIQSFEKISLDRKTRPYRKALDLARIIIENFSPGIQKGNENMIALLFNMDKLWEEYVYQSLKNKSTELNFKVKRECKFLFETGGYNLQPDIIIEKNNEQFIIDAKWKIPTHTKVSIQDLRQIYAYNRFWKSEKGMLLYPGKKNDKQFFTFNDQDIVYFDPNEPNNLNSNSCKCAIAKLNILDNDRLSDSIALQILAFLEIS